MRIVVFLSLIVSHMSRTTCKQLTWLSCLVVRMQGQEGCAREMQNIMLRVTVEERSDQIIFRIEGKLKGPWVNELERCWRSTSGRATGKTFAVDLDGVDFVDDQGKSLLTEMARAGVELIATESMMRSIVQQILEDIPEHSSRAEFNPSMEEHKNG